MSLGVLIHLVFLFLRFYGGRERNILRGRYLLLGIGKYYTMALKVTKLVVKFVASLWNMVEEELPL